MGLWVKNPGPRVAVLMYKRTGCRKETHCVSYVNAVLSITTCATRIGLRAAVGVCANHHSIFLLKYARLNSLLLFKVGIQINLNSNESKRAHVKLDVLVF